MERSILIIILFFLGFLVLGLFCLPKYQQLRALQIEISQKRSILERKEAYLLNLQTLLEQLKNYQEPLAKIESGLPQKPELPSLFDFLQAAATKNGLILAKIDSFSVIGPKEAPQLGEAHIGISLFGSYPGFKDFLLDLENSARLIEVESLSFVSPKEGQFFDFSLAIKVYFEP